MNENTCCGSSAVSLEKSPSSLSMKSVLSWKETPAGRIPIISAALSFSDILGGWLVRWGINRLGYTVNPGIYGIGNPGPESPVLVSANYKFSFDTLRKELSGIDAWILVIDTKGINVWCAAGKGTFGTGELVGRIIKHNLAGLVNHKRIILPQLGAVGVSAHKVTSFTKFKVIYGPVKAMDLPEFLKNGFVKTENMRKIDFRFPDRLALVPMEIFTATNILIIALSLAAAFILSYIHYRHFSYNFIRDIFLIAGSYLMGTVAVPLLLPWIPGRSFAWKGFLAGFLWTLLFTSAYSYSFPLTLFFIFILPPVSSYLALNFTGATTYTSQSGVKKEMKYAIPYYFASLGLGLVIAVAASLFPNINKI